MLVFGAAAPAHGQVRDVVRAPAHGVALGHGPAHAHDHGFERVPERGQVRDRGLSHGLVPDQERVHVCGHVRGHGLGYDPVRARGHAIDLGPVHFVGFAVSCQRQWITVQARWKSTACIFLAVISPSADTGSSICFSSPCDSLQNPRELLAAGAVVICFRLQIHAVPFCIFAALFRSVRKIREGSI